MTQYETVKNIIKAYRMKKLIKPFLFGLVFALGISFSAFPSHYLGGNISWTCLGNDSFLIKMTIYRDCNGTYLSSSNLNAKCASSGQSIATINMLRPSPLDITPVCGHNCSRCSSSTCSFPFGIEKYVYTGILFLANAGSCCEILLEHQGSSRSSTTTTGDPNLFFYIDARLNRCISPCNNSPEFFSDPIRIICIGVDFYYNLNYQDFDMDSNGVLLDSLSFEWTPPLVGYNAPFTYTGTYAFDHPIYY